MSQNLVDLVDFAFHSQRRFEICMSQNVVELVDFVFHSQRRLKILNICMSQKSNYVYVPKPFELVDFSFHSQRRLEILNICISQKAVDWVDLGISLIEAQKFRFVYVP